MPWESGPLYGARPYVAFGVGLVALLTGLVRALLTGQWEDWQWALVVLGLALLIYGAFVLQLRLEYRRESKWSREHKGD